MTLEEFQEKFGDLETASMLLAWSAKLDLGELETLEEFCKGYTQLNLLDIVERAAALDNCIHGEFGPCNCPNRN